MPKPATVYRFKHLDKTYDMLFDPEAQTIGFCPISGGGPEAAFSVLCQHVIKMGIIKKNQDNKYQLIAPGYT